MLKVSEVAKRTGVSKERVRYFARIKNIRKVKIKNVETFLFDADDLTRFLLFIGKRKMKAFDTAQPLLPFEENFTERFYKHTKRGTLQALEKRLEQKIKNAGAKGVARMTLCIALNINDDTLERLLCDLTYRAPIAEDDRIDDRIYWVE